MKRRLLNLLSGLSLLLCLAVAVLWVRSYLSTDSVSFTSDRLYQGVSVEGGLYLQTAAFVRREGDWTGTWLVRGPPPRLSRYKETPGSYAQWRLGKGHGTGKWDWTASPAGDGAGFVIGPGSVGESRLRPALRRASRLLMQHRHVRETKTGTTFKTEWKGEEELLVGRRLWVPYWLPSVWPPCCRCYTCGRGSADGGGIEWASAPPAATTFAPRRGGARSAAAPPPGPRPDAPAAHFGEPSRGTFALITNT